MNDTITRWSVAVFGDSSRAGPWRAGQRGRAVAVFGDSTIDLREESPTGPLVRVEGGRRAR